MRAFGGAHMFGHGMPSGNNGLHARFNGDENIQYAFWGNDIAFDQPNQGLPIGIILCLHMTVV